MWDFEDEFIEKNNDNECYHHGKLGMKWGIRRYQNKDGSLTPEGRKRVLHEAIKLKKKREKKEAREVRKQERLVKKEVNKKEKKSILKMSPDELDDVINKLSKQKIAFDLKRQVEGLSNPNKEKSEKFLSKVADNTKTSLASKLGETLSTKFNNVVKSKLGLVDKKNPIDESFESYNEIISEHNKRVQSGLRTMSPNDPDYEKKLKQLRQPFRK